MAEERKPVEVEGAGSDLAESVEEQAVGHLGAIAVLPDSGRVTRSSSSSMPEPVKLKRTAAKPRAASNSASGGKKPQRAKPLKPWQGR